MSVGSLALDSEVARAVGLAVAVLAAGCYASHTRGDEVDARVAVDAATAVCTTPRDGHCCCSRDALGRLSCADGAWRCEAGFVYHTGAECSPVCGGPCALPCPADAGTPAIVMCFPSPGVFPAFARDCTGATDCDIAAHEIDCCGSILYTGIASFERARFDLAEALCRPQYPECACDGGLSADDGTTPASGPAPYVMCNAGTCETSYFVGG